MSLHGKTVRFGKSDLVLEQPLGAGTMMWGTTCLDQGLSRVGVVDNDELERVMVSMVNKGVTFFDSAEGCEFGFLLFFVLLL